MKKLEGIYILIRLDEVSNMNAQKRPYIELSIVIIMDIKTLEYMFISDSYPIDIK